MFSRERIIGLLLPLLLAACVARLWLMPLPSSFWVDEMATVFVVQHGPNHPSFAVAPQVPDSIYYQLPRAAECALRIFRNFLSVPSVLSDGPGSVFNSPFGARLIYPGAAWFVVFVCLSMRGINDQAADARPYALGTCLAAASLWFLIRWLDSAHWWDAALFIVCGALLWRVHLLFWPFYIVLCVYAADPLAAARNARGWLSTLAVFVLLGIALVPVLVDALNLFRHATSHVIVALPTLRDLRVSLKFGHHPDLRRGRFRSGPLVPLAARVHASRITSAPAADRGLVADAAARTVRRLPSHRQQHVRRALSLCRSARCGAGGYAGRRVFYSGRPLEAAVRGVSPWACCSCWANGASAGRCITARTGGWPRTLSINGPAAIPTPPCFAPARSSKRARRYGSHPMRSPASSIAICRFIRFAASLICCRLTTRPKPSVTSKAWPRHAHRVGPLPHLRRVGQRSLLAQLVFHPPEFSTWRRERLGTLRRRSGGAVRKAPSARPIPRHTSATIRII